jgi:hypothetical protein
VTLDMHDWIYNTDASYNRWSPFVDCVFIPPVRSPARLSTGQSYTIR